MSKVVTLLEYLRILDPGARRARKFRKRLDIMDADARETASKVRDYTMLNPEKLYAFIETVRYISKNNITGTIVECGVWRGGAIMAAALTLLQLGDTRRKFYLYDTFTGMTRPTDRDKAIDGTGNIDLPGHFEKRQTGKDSSDWCYANTEEVRRNLSTLSYNPDNFILVEGKVEDTLPDTLPGPISILRLDTDWYDSTKHEMIHLMPLLEPKGVLIVDDYYRWAGNKEAVDEYLEQHNIPMLMVRVGNSAIGVKPC